VYDQAKPVNQIKVKIFVESSHCSSASRGVP
jgi:hypothetical protein